MIDKSDIGKVFFLVPTGNNVRRGVAGGSYSQIVKVELTKLARVNGVFKPLDGGFDIKFRIPESFLPYYPNHIRGGDSPGYCGANSGYNVYRSIEEINAERHATRLRRLIENNIKNFSDDLIFKISDLAGIKSDVEDL